MFGVYRFLPRETAREAVCKYRQNVIEANLHLSGLTINDVFYERTWSYTFLERVLQPEHTKFWDHVSVWYDVSVAFATRNIDNLNLHSLYTYQNLPKSFFAKYASRVDWVAPGAREAFIADLKS